MTQTEAQALELLELEEVTWPITFRWRTSAWYGSTRQEATIDAPALQGNIEASVALGALLWSAAVAPATSVQAELDEVDVVLWRLGTTPFPVPVFFAPGMLSGQTGPRAHQGCLVLHTGHLDRRARRRFHLPAVPAEWHDGGLMTSSGLRALDGAAKLLWMGLNGSLFGGPYTWLIAYPDALPATATNGRGVGFRKVAYVRSCWHTAKAPELSPGQWP